MKSRIRLLAYASLLLTALTGSLVYAAPPSPASAPTALTPTPRAADTPACTRTPPLTDLGVFVLGLQPKSTDYNQCGLCGPEPCRGLQRGTICGVDGQGGFKRCEYYMFSCPETNQVICECYAEIIP